MHKPFHVKNIDSPWTPTASPSGCLYFSFPSQPELWNGCQYSLFSLPHLPLISHSVPASTSSLNPKNSHYSHQWLSHTKPNRCFSPDFASPPTSFSFSFFFFALSTCQYFAFSRHSVLVSILFFWVLNSVFSASSYKSNHPLSVGPQSLLTPHLIPREADNYMTFLTTSTGFYLFHQNLASHQCSPIA